MRDYTPDDVRREADKLHPGFVSLIRNLREAADALEAGKPLSREILGYMEVHRDLTQP